jgi:hypothetical protein
MKDELKERITNISDYNISDLVHEDSDFNFVEIKDMLKDLIENISSTLQYPKFFDTILDIKTVEKLIDNLNVVLQGIVNFDATKVDNPTNSRQTLIDQIKRLNHQLYLSFIQQYLIFVIRKQLNKGANKELEKRLQLQTKELEKQKDEADGILSTLRETTGQVGITQYEQVFEEEAKLNKNSATIWLISFLSSGVVLMGILAYIFLQIPETTIKNYLWYVSINRIVLLSIAGYLFYQLVKNYNAKMHLYTLNTHRRNCLRVFEKMKDSANSDEVKDEILKQATKTIFESGETGYIETRGSGSGVGAINIIERIGNGMNKK